MALLEMLQVWKVKWSQQKEKKWCMSDWTKTSHEIEAESFLTDRVRYSKLSATISIIETDPFQPISSMQSQVSHVHFTKAEKSLLMQKWDSIAQDVRTTSSQLLGSVKDDLIFSCTSDTEIGNWRKYPPPHQPHKDQRICKHILQT